MPYRRLLEAIVRFVPGAEGAILLDSEGEVVVEAGPQRDFRHRLIGAYQGIALKTALRTGARYGTGAVDAMLCRYDQGTLILRPLKDGYYFVVALRPEASVAEAMWRTDAVRDRMNEEL
ncbi:MAG TPA: roadblock/LC7 domain-containing protein [Vicinamibacteria bacterium]|nr:roadblock/LC7 domain-containing protein [Vicinamibacteria bacterium]